MNLQTDDEKIILDYKDINYRKNITVPANSIINFTDSDIGRVTPTDYIFGMILQITTGSADIVVRNFGINGYSVRNLIGQAIPAEFFLSIRYIRIIKETMI